MAVMASAQSAQVKTAMDAYARFSAGDIPGILALLSPEVVWTHAGDPAVLPFAGTFKGKAEVGRFFEAVGKSLQIMVFSPTNFRESGNTVSNDTHIEGTVLSTGKKYSDELVMTWTFGADGQVISWAATGTMAGIMAAYRK